MLKWKQCFQNKPLVPLCNFDFGTEIWNPSWVIHWNLLISLKPLLLKYVAYFWSSIHCLCLCLCLCIVKGGRPNVCQTSLAIGPFQKSNVFFSAIWCNQKTPKGCCFSIPRLKGVKYRCKLWPIDSNGLHKIFVNPFLSSPRQPVSLWELFLIQTD